MSINLNLKIFKNNKDKAKMNKPIINYLNHLSELDLDSKKHITALQIESNYKNTNIFDVKNQYINGVDLSNQNEEDQFINNRQINESNNNNNSININLLNINKDQINQNSSNIQRSYNYILQQQQNKKILRKPQKKRQQKKMNKKNNKNNKNKGISRNSKSVVNNISKTSKASKSKRSNSSQNSTKRANYLLKARNSPEKYPEDYLSIDSSDNEEKEIQRKEMQISDNSTSLLYKNILEKGKIINKDYDPRIDIEQKLEGFDLMSVDVKAMYRDDDFKKKYFKNFKDEIIIVYFDKEQIPLHAIFIFNDSNQNNNNIVIKEKKLFPGAYEKDEFIGFCSGMLIKKIPVKVELLMDYAEMSKNKELHYMGINPQLLNDFYFLIDILS